MIHRKLLAFLFIVFAIPCVEAIPAPFVIEFRIVNKLFKTAATESPSQAGLVALEQLAAGRPEDVDADLAASVGIKQETIDLPWLRASAARAHAMRKIGETGRQEAIAFLAGFPLNGFTL